jgi:diguanylate cyclase
VTGRLKQPRPSTDTTTVTLPPLELGRSFGDFRGATRAVLLRLSEQLPLGLWMVTRTVDDDWIVLDAVDRSYGVQRGDVFRWSDSLCARMVRGEGPMVAPRAAEVAAFADAPIRDTLEIGSYVGVPLAAPDGSLFGTVCAIDRKPHEAEMATALPEIMLLARLLSTVLHKELEQQEAWRRAERAENESQLDPLTGLGNRRSWERTVAAEEARCRRYGSPASVLSIDLDALKQVNDERGHAFGDELLVRAAAALRASVRTSDFVARIGGDEFAVLAVEADAAAAEALAVRVCASLTRHGVAGSVGVAAGPPQRTLVVALHEADRDMYRVKRGGSATDAAWTPLVTDASAR